MKLSNLFILSLGTTVSHALPSSANPVSSNDLLTITALYEGDTCAGPQHYWYISTRADTWFQFLSKTDGCQPVNSTWEISSAKAAWLAEGCQNKECKENGATPSFDQCTTSTKNKWRSFAIRGCAATKGEPELD